MERLVCLGLSHRTAPVELRERIGALGLGAERCPAVLEHVSLQTCYRVELYARLATGLDDARDELLDALSRAHGVARGELVGHLYVHSGADVARHLARVAAGLDSLVLGEAEILGQVRDAFETARAQGTSGPGLALLQRAALTAGRRARAETGIGANPATASTMALALAEGVIGRLRGKHVLVVGAGRIGLQTLKALAGREVASLSVANRTAGRAAEVAGRFGAEPYGLDALGGLVSRVDVVVSATSSELAVLDLPTVRDAMAERARRPLVVVDLAVPADVERGVGAIPGVRLFDVDDLRAGLDESMAARLREVPAVEAIVEEEVDRFVRRFGELEVEPIVSELRRRAEGIRTRELARALRDLGDVEPHVAEGIDHLSRVLVKRLLHDPTARLRERAGAGEAGEVADTVRDLFGIAPPSDR